MPIQIFRNDLNDGILNKIILEFKDEESNKLFDLLKLPQNYTDNLYIAYELLTLIGNSPENRAEKNIQDNRFRCRRVYRLYIKATEIGMSKD